MKKLIILLSGFLLIAQINVSAKDPKNGAGNSRDSLKILSTSDLYGLSSVWSVEYSKLFPGKPVKVINIGDGKISGKIESEGNIAFVTGDFPGLSSQSIWRIVVGRDVIVPVINSKNPYMDELTKQGITQNTISDLLKTSNKLKWGDVLKSKADKSVNVYLVNDGSVRSVLADFIRTDPSAIHVNKSGDSKKMISAIQKDPYALGFCKMINVVDFKNQSMVENIRLLPIDRNGNGTIDYNEKIYDDFNNFSRGVWIGKYPRTLFSNIYSVSSSQPQSEAAVAFLKWVLTDGQQYLYDNGYSDLLLVERQITLDKLNTAKVYTPIMTSEISLSKIILLILASLAIIGFIIDALIKVSKRRKAVAVTTGTGSHSILSEKSILIPKGLYFDKSHTWAFMDQDGIVKVGVDDFMQHIAGPITRIKMKGQGKKVKKGEAIISIIQNGKQLNLYAPLSGTIIEQNDMLDSNSSLINSSPYKDGWVYKIEPDNWNRESQLLFMVEKEKEHIREEFARLKDFLAMVMNPDKILYAMAVLQDGGELCDGVLHDFGPEIWDDFQTKFIDPSKQVWFYEII